MSLLRHFFYFCFFYFVIHSKEGRQKKKEEIKKAKAKRKLSTKQGKQIYKHRMHDAEGVFTNIKKNLKFTTFNLRELKGVNTEWL